VTVAQATGMTGQRAICSIRLLCGEAVPIKARTSWMMGRAPPLIVHPIRFPGAAGWDPAQVRATTSLRISWFPPSSLRCHSSHCLQTTASDYRPYNARMSCEHGRSGACEAEAAEGTGTDLAQGVDPTQRPRGSCQPRADSSIRLLYGDAPRFKARDTF
jgi:hypothetical protein